MSVHNTYIQYSVKSYNDNIYTIARLHPTPRELSEFTVSHVQQLNLSALKYAAAAMHSREPLVFHGVRVDIHQMCVCVLTEKRISYFLIF